MFKDIWNFLKKNKAILGKGVLIAAGIVTNPIIHGALFVIGSLLVGEVAKAIYKDHKLKKSGK